ncbi:MULTISPECIES: hypothetical protein [unclassified Sinorhizobium]|nr:MULTISPECIES: hypothetical protein [unclassified Sinorhizobium]MDK1376777.1 hypothetical protein [Sinorhizobium sp. 6-70]MDK1479549.1 hypothetical protein [Sinorhizobium sp. 6-117]
MSDERTAATQPHRDHALYVHYCEHSGCTKWGGFGFAVGKAEPN